MKTDAIAHASPSHCLNCGTAVDDLYCGHCGQDTANHMPSAAEFLHEFVGHYVALENKLLKTLALLLFRPGRLTRDYLEGKRARYVLPLRLYLTFSLIFFAIVKWEAHHIDLTPAKPTVTAGHTLDQKDLDQARHELEDAVKQPGAGGAVAAAGEKVLRKIEQKAQEKQAQARDGEPEGKTSFFTVGEDSRGWVAQHFGQGTADRVARFGQLSGEEQLREVQLTLFAYLPYAIFAMMPMFALYLKLLYLGSGRKYGEHLLFALHTNAFAFLLLILMILVPMWIPYAHGLMWLWLLFYLPTAMRKVYGGSRLATFLRWIVAMLLHLLGMIGAIVAVLALAVVH